MSPTAVTTSVIQPPANLEVGNTRLPLMLSIPNGDTRSFKQGPRQLAHGTGFSPHLQFLTVTENPEVERKSTANRRTVRSHAIKHAVQKRRQSMNSSLRRPESSSAGEHRIPSLQTVGTTPHTSHGSTDPCNDRSREKALQVATKIDPRPLWPVGTVAASTNSSEIDLIFSHFRQIRTHCSIFSHLLDTPESEQHLGSVVLQSQAIYHATLYTATMQKFACAVPCNDIRGALFHEALVLRFVQRAISQSRTPSEEIIFATALLGIAQLIFDKNQSGAMHLEGVAQMVRLRGGVKRISIPVLYNLLEWLVGMHTLNIAPDVEYGHKLPPPFNIRPQLPCHEPDESLKPSDDISFMFFARRRILYPYVAKSLEMLAPDVNRPGPKCRKMRAHSAMLALAGWRPASGQVPYERIPQMDEGARLAGLLYYRLVYAGGRHDQTTESMAMRLKEECLLLRNEQHLFSQLYRGCSNRLCLILWILYCGGSFATGELRAWYAEHVKLIAGGTGKDWTRTKDILRRFVWDDKACEGPMKQLWRESLMQEWMGTDDQVRAPRAVGEA